jgi:outer membrane lipoprotein SlyB
MKRPVMATVIIAALSLSGCAGERPDKEELASALTASNMTNDQAKCAAEVLLGSDLSDRALKAIAENDAHFKPDKADVKAQSAVMEELTKCRT